MEMQVKGEVTKEELQINRHLKTFRVRSDDKFGITNELYTADELISLFDSVPREIEFFLDDVLDQYLGNVVITVSVATPLVGDFKKIGWQFVGTARAANSDWEQPKEVGGIFYIQRNLGWIWENPILASKS